MVVGCTGQVPGGCLARLVAGYVQRLVLGVHVICVGQCMEALEWSTACIARNSRIARNGRGARNMLVLCAILTDEIRGSHGRHACSGTLVGSRHGGSGKRENPRDRDTHLLFEWNWHATRTTHGGLVRKCREAPNTRKAGGSKKACRRRWCACTHQRGRQI